MLRAPIRLVLRGVLGACRPLATMGAWLVIVLGLGGLAWPLNALAKAPESRLALVIGAGDYPTRPLANARNDAGDMARALGERGFVSPGQGTLTPLIDPTKGQFHDAVVRLVDQARGDAAAGRETTVVFYFAGHGVQFKGSNYLLPTGTGLFARPPTEGDFMDQAIAAHWVLDKLAETGAARVILILDACRTNPFNPNERAFAADGGLAAMGPPSSGADALIFYAAEPRRPAVDSVGGSTNSPFTAALVEFVGYPMDVNEMFGHVRNRVMALTDRQQRPYFEGALVDWSLGPASLPEAAPVQSREAALMDGDDFLVQTLKTRSIESIQGLADRGDGFSQWLLSVAYAYGRGVPRNYEEAVKWARRAVLNGVDRATVSLGAAYYSGRGVPRDAAEAVRWFELGAEREVPLAWVHLGVAHYEGKGVFRSDPVLAAEYFGKAADRDVAIAHFNLGRLYQQGLGVAADGAAARRHFQRAADLGSGSGFRGLGDLHLLGIGVEADDQRALTYYRKAIELNNPDALASLGFMYADGLGVQEDPAEAMKYFRRAWAREVGFGAMGIGYLYAAGKGVPRDVPQAIEWYRMAYQAGVGLAADRIGVLLRDGDGVAADPVQAHAWFGSAAGANDIEGVYHFGLSYLDGLGVRADPMEAHRYFLRAAEAGHAEAAYQVGAALLSGRGVDRDVTKAIDWLKTGAERGSEAAARLLGATYREGATVPRDEAEARRWEARARELARPERH